MPPRKRAAKTPTAQPVSDYRHDDAKRRNNPPAGLASQGRVRETPKLRYAYDPHLPPALRFDPTGEWDRADALLAQAQEPGGLTEAEAIELAKMLRNREPWLEWTGKREAKEFVVDPVALHIHERISAQAILNTVRREDVQRDLFADPQQEYREAVRFYEHDVDWANRMILGDSLQVMASLAHREDLRGKIQMIYMDPPYGIRFASNFQPEIGRRDVKDREQDLTREPEMVKAYRDTWTLGVHSYLAYLRDRLMLAKDLLTDSGSIFVQISDENLHRVRMVMDEVFGSENFCRLITFAKTSGQTDNLMASVSDYLLWYARDRERVKYRQVYRPKTFGGEGAGEYKRLFLPSGMSRTAAKSELSGQRALSPGTRAYRLDNLTSQSPGTRYDVEFRGRTFYPTGYWKTQDVLMPRLIRAERIAARKNSLSYVRYFDDFPVTSVHSTWDDTAIAGRPGDKLYVVQTAPKVIERCLLMTTDPGDLVFDPTCGSGTTAYVAEQWGRRWITTDTSRVALALARQRLLTATFPHYAVRDDDASDGKADPSRGFIYKTVPHITLKSIAQNVALDPIFERHQKVLDTRLAELNKALKSVKPDLRKKLKQKLAAKEKAEGKRAVTDADRRRWLLPDSAWQEWEVPFDTDDEWPKKLQDALVAYRAAWRAKMDEVNETIVQSAPQEELVDQPEVERNVVRVSGPFTMEAVMPAELSDAEPGFAGAPDDDLDTFDPATDEANAEGYVERMLRLLGRSGIRFPDNRTQQFARLDRIEAGVALHAEGEWANGNAEARRVLVSIGPQHGPVTATQVEQALREAYRRGADDLVFAGFSFDGAAQAAIQDDANPQVRTHLAHIAPDVQMGDLLKTAADSQLFTVFGQPRTELHRNGEEWTVEMQGVDIYDPVKNTIHPTRADRVAAWFVDSDYDGRTFCVTQAFFPDRNAWKKLERALGASIADDAFDALSGTMSLPFRAGKHGRVAVKVIDPRGNEVMRVHRLG